MRPSSQKTSCIRRWLRRIKQGLSKLRSRSPSAQLAQSASDGLQTPAPLKSQSPHISPIPLPTSSTDVSNPIDAKLQPGNAVSAIKAPPVTEPTTKDPNPLHNVYTIIGGLPTEPLGPMSLGQRVKEVGGTAYAGLTTIVQSLYDCSDMFLPLKTATGVFLTIDKVASVRKTHCPAVNIDFYVFLQRVLANRQELEELEAKLAAILSIVQKYKKHGGIDALSHRIETFSQFVYTRYATVFVPL